METFAKKIESQLKTITSQLSDLIKDLSIGRMDRFDSDTIVISPEYYFEEPSSTQRNIQICLKNRYDDIYELLKVIFKNAPDDLLIKLERVDKLFRMWLQLESNWFIEESPRQNAQSVLKVLEEFSPILDIINARDQKGIILIPDTNSLLISCEPLVYKKIIRCETFTIILLPTVLNELDKLKNLHRNPDVREKALKAIKRIKGWRKQGKLLEGIKVEKTISIKTIHNEPNMDATLSWLDKDVADDRIIASVIEIQAQFPSSPIIFITSDINLQNKSDAAMICYADLENI